MSKKQYVVIGLGRFGTSIAETLYQLGNDVLVIDHDDERIQLVANNVTHAIQADATDEIALREVGLRNFDVGIVSIGSDIQASIMATILLKELGLKMVVTKATNSMHAKVLTKVGADKVIFPEKDMGIRVAHGLAYSNVLEYIELSPKHSLAEFRCPRDWWGRTLKEINVRIIYGINVIAIKRDDEVDVAPSANEVLNEDDVIVAIGSIEDLTKFENNIK
ncbi:trk system potassium uptake protein TrkA [Hathewaya proteolytica DSM 3090]|uniref:Trk system potassium uptake protein TrkA n=1 Tax=Hathewaya proteolytica DSM 3090 TaxID=1121331 RepID=A0A1M6QSF1_9CLOT|nr:TrkA family potassium uptake protein [Hathewaya proteolytica]SHK23038.1 trk system potassium uptake protein TrkA [Hathewaya proteolytica DSM 3090]